MVMNERQLVQHVLTLVRQVIVKKNLPARSSANDVIKALEFPGPRYTQLQDGADGARSGEQILINKHIMCAERTEFTLFHEIVHILIEQDGEIESQLLDHFYYRSDAARDRVLENLCNIGAAEFMMPALEFAEVLRAGEWRLEALGAAAQTFKASVIACAFQFAHHNPDRCTVVVCEQGLLPRRNHNLTVPTVSEKPFLHVAYVAYHPEEEYRMCRFVPVPSDHPICHAWNSRAAMIGKADGFFLTPKAWKIPCEITCIGGRVYTAYYAKGRNYQPGQVSLFGD